MELVYWSLFGEVVQFIKMRSLLRYNKITLTLFAALLTTAAYLALSYYEDIKLSLTQKPPKALLADSSDELKCELPQGEKNRNKLMFVSCSGFYDE